MSDRPPPLELSIRTGRRWIKYAVLLGIPAILVVLCIFFVVDRIGTAFPGIVATVVVSAAMIRVAFMPSVRLDEATVLAPGLVRARQLPLEEVSRARLRSNHGGSALLQLSGARGRPVNVPVMMMTDFVEGCLPADTLGRLGDVLAEHRINGAEPIRAVLDEQAAYLRSGGDLEHSPMRPLTDDSLLRAGAAAGSLSGLDQ